MKMNHPNLIVIISLIACSCGRNDSDNSGYSKNSVDAVSGSNWTAGVPEIRGQVPEIHLLLSTRGVTISPSYSIDGANWAATLSTARNMNPKPNLLVSVDRNVSETARTKYLLKISRAYECVSYKCFYQWDSSSNKAN